MRMTSVRLSILKDSRGVTALEFTFIITLFLTLTFSVFNFGLAYLRSTSLSSSLADGGRKAAVHLGIDSCQEFTDTTCNTIKNSTSSLGLQSATVSVSIGRISPGQCELTITSATNDPILSFTHQYSYPVEDTRFCLSQAPCREIVCSS